MSNKYSVGDKWQVTKLTVESIEGSKYITIANKYCYVKEIILSDKETYRLALDGRYDNIIDNLLKVGSKISFPAERLTPKHGRYEYNQNAGYLGKPDVYLKTIIIDGKEIDPTIEFVKVNVIKPLEPQFIDIKIDLGFNVLGNTDKRFPTKNAITNYIGGLLKWKSSQKEDVDITTDEVIDLYKKQNGRCALTGEIMSAGKDEHAVSLDRIKLGIQGGKYELSNVQLVCKLPNMIKGTFTEDQLKFWLPKMVTNKSDSKITEFENLILSLS